MRNLWSVVVHDTGIDFVNIWIGTLHPNLRKPTRITAKLFDDKDNYVQQQDILQTDWKRPFRHLKQRFFTIIQFENLQIKSRYKMELYEERDGTELEIPMTDVYFDTLGSSLDDYSEGLNVAMGSCFSEQYDGGSVSLAYEALYKANIADVSPHFNFLLGDQVYLDVGLDSLSPQTREIRERIAGDYALHWNALQGVFKSGATWFLPDDHEFWNNYPFLSWKNPYTQALRIDKVKHIWKQTARDGINNIQNAKPVRVIEIGEDLTFCLADFRSKRTEKRLLQTQYFNQVLAWFETLKSPGVLVISQPLIDEAGDEDMKLPNYDQYAQLLRAMQDAAHDVLVLAGDLHCGRVASFQFKAASRVDGECRVMHEVVASPLSNLSGPTSLAARTQDKSNRPKTFPPVEVDGVESGTVDYPKNWVVSSEFDLTDLRYLKERTKEHFTTLNFQKVGNAIEVKVMPWRVRDVTRDTGLPRQDFPEPVKFKLR